MQHDILYFEVPVHRIDLVQALEPIQNLEHVFDSWNLRDSCLFIE